MNIVQNTDTLRDRQLALEEESLTLGIDRYQKEHARQDEADSGPGRRLPTKASLPYLTDAGGLVPLVRTRNKSYLRELGNVDMPVVYQSINSIQSSSALTSRSPRLTARRPSC